MQRGFDDAKAGGIDPILGTADTREAKEYRDGHRQARRDAFDGIELEGDRAPLWPVVPEPAVATSSQPPEPREEPSIGKAVPIGNPSPESNVVETVDGLVCTKEVREGDVVVIDSRIAATVVPPKKRKPKPVDSDQLSLL